MELYLLRHGPAGQAGDPRYKDDTKRPLTPEGAEKMRLIARGMAVLELPFDTILCSPYLRAKQTAQITVEVLKLKKTCLHYTNNLIPDASFEKLALEVRTDFADAKHLLLVGHEPHLSGLMAYLLQSATPINIELKKGGLGHLSQMPTFGGGPAVLNWLLNPTQLCLMAR